jgi:twitching motility protein PilU
VDGKRCAAFEVMLGTSTIQEKIMNGEIKEIKEIMAASSESTGMQTFDDSLFKLYKSGKIDAEEALINADSANDMRLKMNLNTSNAQPEEKKVKTKEPAQVDNPLAGMQFLDEED